MVMVKYGDTEGAEWWEKHKELFEKARRELGELNPGIYHLASSDEGDGIAACARWLQVDILRALVDRSAEALRSVLEEVVCDGAGFCVYRLNLFKQDFCDMLLAELDHLETSGIPLRRPNGMNRYGAILSHLGFQDGLMRPLMRLVVHPLARLVWPEWVAPDDLDETYGFVVRYRLGEDLSLAEHADTSNVTLNACLGRVFESGDIYFKGVRFTDSADEKIQRRVSHRKGTALLHLGGHFHGVDPITSGERSNLVLWGTGHWGQVRIRPDKLPASPQTFTSNGPQPADGCKLAAGRPPSGGTATPGGSVYERGAPAASASMMHACLLS